MIFPLVWGKNWSRSLLRATTLCSAPADDKSDAGGLWPGEIPSILNICASCEPTPPVSPTFMPLPSRNTSAGRPAVPGTALLPLSSCLCLKRKQYAIFLALMVPLFMVMQQILLQGSPQRRLSDQDELCQAFLFA